MNIVRRLGRLSRGFPTENRRRTAGDSVASTLSVGVRSLFFALSRSGGDRVRLGVVVKRTLGKSRIQVSAMGLGTARIGGLGWRQDEKTVHEEPGQIEVDIRAIHRALDLGIDFFDTAILLTPSAVNSRLSYIGSHPREGRR